MIISIRGTNGSGKSTVMRGLMADSQRVAPIYGCLGPRLPEANELIHPEVKQKIYVLGPYVTECGGCDRIIPYDLIPQLISKYAARGHVLFEGVIVTSVYGQVGALLEKWKKDAVFLFLDTPLETCLKRIETRSGKPRDTRLVKNVDAKFRTGQRIRRKVEKEGILGVISVSDQYALSAVVNLLKSAKWNAVAIRR